MENISSAATVDVVEAFLERLVDSSLVKNESVAKQMYAVVMLFNYYLRKQDPKRGYVGFEDFCKLVVNLRSNLRLYMKHMLNKSVSGYQEKIMQSGSNMFKLFSETEKAIYDACNLCLVLSSLKDNPNPKIWPVSKVAVLLIDLAKQNCYLSYNSVTKGVFSLIEKDVDRSEGIETQENNKKSLLEKDAGYRKLAVSAVNEATRIKQADLKILETHVAYSLSKEKTTAQFYIMQCAQSAQDIIKSPLKDLMESLHGPLVKRNSDCWKATSVVEYYHLLPYASFVSDWFSRQIEEAGQIMEMMSNTKKNLKRTVQNDNNNTLMTADVNHPHEQTSGKEDSLTEADVNHQHEQTSGKEDSLTAADVNRQHEQTSGKEDSLTVNEPLRQTNSGSDHVDVYKSSSPCRPQKNNESENMCMEGNTHHHEKRRKTCSTHKDGMDALMSSDDLAAKVDESRMKPIASECRLNDEILKKLSKTALKVLCRKKEKLAHQIHAVEEKMQTIMNGGDDDMTLSLQVLIDNCNEGEDEDKGDSVNKDGQQQCSCQKLKQNGSGKPPLLCLPSPMSGSK